MPVFPVDLYGFLGGCARVRQQLFDLGDGQAVQSRTAGGEVIGAHGSVRLWHGRVDLHNLRYKPARALHAKLRALVAPGAVFWIADRRHTGAAITGALGSVTDGKMRITGLPVGAVIEVGDYIAFDYAGRRALHQAVERRVRGADGSVAGFDVVPPIRPGAVAGAAVTIGPAKCLGKIVPGSVRVGEDGPVATSGASFEWVQTLRGA